MFLLNIRMINLSLNELKVIAQIRNMSDYENKSKEDLIKTLSEPKSETLKRETSETKPKTTPKQTLKPKTPKATPGTKLKTTPKQTPKPETK